MTWLIYAAAAVFEIAGCFAVWSWLRSGRDPLWLIPALASLFIFALLLARVPADAAGRAFAAYGGVYIAASLAWMALVEGQRLDRWDIAGATLCLLGAATILLPARG